MRPDAPPDTPPDAPPRPTEADAPSDAASPRGASLAPKPAGPDAGPPSLATRRRSRRTKVVGVVVVALALGLPAYLSFASERVAAAGATGFLALFAALLSLLVGGLGFVLARDRPRALGLVALGSLLGALALVVGGLGARLAIRAATLDALDEVGGLGPWKVAVATTDARTGAWLALAGVLGAALGAFGVLRAARARQSAAREALHLGQNERTSEIVSSRQIAVAWASFAGVTLAGLGALALDSSLLVTPHAEVAHPNEAAVREVAIIARSGESDLLCEKLEAVLAVDFAPEELLDRELPDRRELAHRCVTRGIDRLPQGLKCMVEASVLSQGRTAKLVGAEDRVVAACKRSLVP